MQTPQIEIVADAQEVAARCARLFASAAQEAVASRGVFRTALSGGRTPEGFFRRLADGPEAGAMPWGRTHVFWVDERYVPADSPASNYRLAVETLLSRVAIPQANIHRVPTEGIDIRDAARAYEQTLREVFGLPAQDRTIRSSLPPSSACPRRLRDEPQFDLIVLGMGSDGHTASLFPNSLVRYDTDDLVCAVHPGDAAKHDRITLTAPVLLAARRLVVLVCGGEKAQTLKEVLAGEPGEMKYPIQMLRPIPDRVVWLVDREAAALVGPRRASL